MNRRHRILRYACALLVIGWVASCGGDSGGSPEPARLSLVSGIGQSAAVGTPLPQPVVIQVLDDGGKPVPGTAVQWAVTAGGGSIAGASTRSDRDGRAQVTWTLGTTSGAQSLSATVAGITPVSIAATALAGPAATLAPVAGDGQQGTVGVTLLQNLVVRVRDAYDNPVAGAPVTFTPGSGFGSAAATATATNASGVAQTAWTLGPNTGVQTLTAQVTGVPAATYQFTAVASEAAVIELQNDVAVAGLAAPEGSLRYYRIVVPAGTAQLAVRTTGGSGDADLYVTQGTLPTTGTYDCRSVDPATTETCVLAAPAPGEWFILLHAFTAYGDVTLRATHTAGGSLALAVTGLPAGASSDITVSGPPGYRSIVAGSQLLDLLLPGAYTIAAAPLVSGGALYAPVPLNQQVQVSAGVTANAAVTYEQQEGGRNFYIGGLHVTQAIQTMDRAVPLVAGRTGLLRVFALSTQVFNSDAPAVRVRIYRNGSLLDTQVLPAPAASTPVLLDPSVMVRSWNVMLPPALVQDGLEVLVDVDPADAIEETDETDNRYPADGTPLPLTVVNAPPHRALLVPVFQTGNNLTGDVNAGNTESYLTLLRAIYPLPDVEAEVRSPYTFTGLVGQAFDAEWERLLNEIWALRNADGSSRYYYGIFKPNHNSGAAGLGYVGFPAAIGADWAGVRDWILAHEVGHNFGRGHVGCGGAGNLDPNYPYPGGQIGLHGWDVRSNALVSASATYDVMSYCRPGWASDYTYEAVRLFRGTAGVATDGVQPSLLVWGRISPAGIVLEPAFEVQARPQLPKGGGRHRIEVLDASGARLVELAFEGESVDHMDDVVHFAFTVPLRSLQGRAPARIRLRAAGREAVQEAAAAAPPGEEVRASRSRAGRVRVQWNAARHPVLMVRDPGTGAVLSFARGGDVEVVTPAGELEVHASNGVRSTGRRVRVDR